jgi:hypothetical protein
MAFAETEKEWAGRVARHLKAELERAGVTYEEFSVAAQGLRLQQQGGRYNKLSRAKLSALSSSHA